MHQLLNLILTSSLLSVNGQYQKKKVAPRGNVNANSRLSRVSFANGVLGSFDKAVKLRPLEDVALEDPIGQEWLSFGPDRMSSPSAKRYAQIKTMLLAFQDWQSFGKFDYYGCYCFPEGQNLALGKGKPVDGLDLACKRWMSCQMCASFDDKLINKQGQPTECIAETTDYKFEAKYLEGNKAKVVCVNSGRHGTCSRAICECDAEFVESLARLEQDYNINNHMVWGNFDKNGNCLKTKHTKAPSTVLLKSAMTGDQQDSDSEHTNTASQPNHRESINSQMKKASFSAGIVDSCCVKQYPSFTLYRSASQKCCSSSLANSYESNVFHPGSEADERHYECCMDGSVEVVENGGCNKKHEDL